jgi:hypothetical protein
LGEEAPSGEDRPDDGHLHQPGRIALTSAPFGVTWFDGALPSDAARA